MTNATPEEPQFVPNSKELIDEAERRTQELLTEIWDYAESSPVSASDSIFKHILTAIKWATHEANKENAKHIAAAVEEAKREERERIADNLRRYANEHFPTGAIRSFAVASELIEVATRKPTP